MVDRCRVCSSQRLKTVTARETMYRTAERFEYLECEACGTLQIAEFPQDMSAYYPGDYYSFADVWVSKSKLRNAAKRCLLPLALRFPEAGLANYFRMHTPWLLHVPGLRPTSRILDLGCGKGHLLHKLREWGFCNLWGADPYIAEDEIGDGIRILNGQVADLDQRFDLIMMHHSLEHVENPLEVMSSAKRLLAPGGSLVIRIPLMGSAVWEKYGTDWVQLDAPRHFTLFTAEAFICAAQRLGLRPKQIAFDAGAFSIRGSEAIRRGIGIFWNSDQFTAEENWAFENEIQRLNREGRSDQACFVLGEAPS